MPITSYPPNTEITFEPLQRDAFGYVRVSNKQGEFEYKQIHGRHPTVIQERVYGAVIEHGAITGSFNIGDTFEDDERSTCTITAVGAGDITYDCKGGNQFTDTATLTILTGVGVGSTATINTHDTGADLDYDYNRSSTMMSVGTVSGQRVIRQTPYMHYISGDSKRFDATVVFGQVNANQELYLIYGDDLNGWGFCTKDGVVNIILRSSVTGSVVETLIPQADWDDPLDGTGPSGITLDITKFQIDGGDLQWLGGGARRFFASIGGKSIFILQIDNANINDSVYSKTASLPIRWEILNTGTATANTLESVCCAVNNEGGNALLGLDFTIDSGKTLRTITIDEPIGLVVMKDAFPTGEPNRQTVQLINWGAEAVGNANVLIKIFHVHGIKSITGTAITDFATELGIDYYTNITAIDAAHSHEIGAAQIIPGVGGKGDFVNIPISTIASHNKIAQNIESDGSTGFLIFAYPYGNADVWWKLNLIGKE